MRLVWSDAAWEDYLHWRTRDRNTRERLNSLLKECRRTPFTGSGRPEPLKGELKGWWSRRITLEDRLVYRVSGKGDDQALEIRQCRLHY